MSDSERQFDAPKAERVRSWFKGVPQAPYSMEVSPVMACNVNCRFCRRKDELAEYYGHTRDLPDDRWYEILKEAIEMGTKRILFRGGGEPGLKRRLFERLFPLIEGRDVECSLLTNGTLVDDSFAEGMVLSGWHEVIVSLHGGDAETHDYITDQSGSFEKVEASLEKINRYKKRHAKEKPILSFHVVLTRRSYSGLDAIIDLAKKHGCVNVGVFPMHNPPYPEYVEELVMREEDQKEYLKLVPGYQKRLEEYGIGHAFELYYQGGEGNKASIAPVVGDGGEARRKGETTARSAIAGIGVRSGALPVLDRPGTGTPALPCYFPWYHATITPTGFLSPCCYGEGFATKGDLGRISFKEAWLGHDIAADREKMLDGSMRPFCSKCPNWYQADNRRLREIFALGEKE